MTTPHQTVAIKLNELVGLKNIGNTCFMNSAMQCIFHIDFLMTFFLSGQYLNEINTVNKLGTNGHFVKEVARNFEAYYSGKFSVLSLYQLKEIISTYNNLFSGYQQHDAQELWGYVIDKIHEDTNRILRKPITEPITVDPNESLDLVFARKSW